jgi:8-oxo-dGTP pyrophosphatase MutT (NUDIX family)
MPELVSKYIEVHVCYKSKSNHQYLMLKRSDKNTFLPNIWQMVTGTVEENEKVVNTIIRELKEETGLDASEIIVIPRINTFFMHTNDEICLCPVFLVFVKDKTIKLSDEHSKFKWVNYTKAKKLIYWIDQIDSLDLIESIINNKKKLKKLIRL